ncbi:MAG TPA: 30S ribosomal protein S6 [Bacteroidetes bacterium]|nr:30S ribosomal protein S6 [Bacteroidota bacterium]
MRQYEVNFIVDPVLSGDEIKEAAQTYVNLIQENGNKIVHVDEMGLRQLAYPIKKRTTGMYYCVEFQNDENTFIPKLELALRRDERIMRFLSVKLDRYGVEYNEKKRNGLIGKKDDKREKLKEDIKKVKEEAVKVVEPKAKSEEE